LASASNENEYFLTSDWYSLESGAPWFTPLLEKLRECNDLLVMITRPEAFSNPWINFEIGAGFGSGKKPRILVYGGVSWDRIPHPIGGLQLIDTGDGNRWVHDLEQIGVSKERDSEIYDRRSRTFRQRK
jgi:hypothetical protein